jgi:hypothetical protein
VVATVAIALPNLDPRMRHGATLCIKNAAEHMSNRAARRIFLPMMRTSSLSVSSGNVLG